MWGCGTIALGNRIVHQTNYPVVENGPGNQYARRAVGQFSNLPHFLTFPPNAAWLEKTLLLPYLAPHNATPYILTWGLGEAV